MKTNSARAGELGALAGAGVGDRHRLELALAAELDDLGVRQTWTRSLRSIWSTR